MQHWQPSAPIEAVIARANLLRQLRDFFNARAVLEVETPLLARYGVTDVHTDNIEVSRSCFLQTSPEYAMKRLLAAYHQRSIFQIGKAFRAEQAGKSHNPEFTMLEWYRVGFDHLALMQEVDELLQAVLQTKPARILSYQALFQEFLQLDPLTASIAELQQCCSRQGINIHGLEMGLEMDRDDWLNLLLTSYIEAKLQGDSPWIIYNYPISQAALAQVDPMDPRVAQRFEVYVRGMELANGYHELTCPEQHRQRFIADNLQRQAKGKPLRELDQYLLSALASGLPACAGVALGVDRLLMLQLSCSDIKEVLNFPCAYNH